MNLESLRELEEVVELVAKATPGPWRWSENGNLMASGDRDVDEICAVYTERDDDAEPANAAAIRAAVNFIREHGAALLATHAEPKAGAVAWLVESGEYRQPFLCKATADAQVFELRKGGYEVSITPLGNTFLHPADEAGKGEARPVAWAYRSEDPYDGGQWMLQGPTWEGEQRPDRREVIPLYTTPTAGLDAAVVKDAERLGAFAASILNLDEEWIGDVEGGTLQDNAVKFGLLEPVEVTEACGDGCNCASYGDFPQTCYRPTDTMKRAIAAMSQEVGR